MSRRLSSLLWAALLLAPPAIILVAAGVVYRMYALDLPPRLGEGARAAAMAPLRAAVDGAAPARPDAPELRRHASPAVAVVWLDGRLLARAQGEGRTSADAILAAAQQLAAAPEITRLDADARRRARIQLDLVVARGRIPRSSLPRAFALVPGMDGLGVTVDGKDVLLTASDLVDARLYDAARPLPLVPELRVGLDFSRADLLLAQRAALAPGRFGAAPRRYFRFRADSFVEAREHAGAPLPLTRDLPPGPPVSRDTLLAAARAGGDYLISHLDHDGRFVYEVDLATGARQGGYSLPRHAGCSYFLAQLYRATKDATVREAVERALDHLARLVEEGGCTGVTSDGDPYSCVVDHGQTLSYLGSTALAVVAFAEYRLGTGDTRYDNLLRRLAAFLRDMQRPDGSFVHLYDLRTGRRRPDQLLYFDGEAALALSRSYKVTGDARLLPAVEKAIDHSIAFYDFFAGRFFVGEEHWTCIAAESAWPELEHDRWREFCSDYGAFLRRQQLTAEEFPAHADLAGAYGVTAFVLPQNTPVGSRTETMISAWQLGAHHGRPDEAIRKQVLAALAYLLRQQIRPDNDYWVREPHGDGGMPASPANRTVRIDYVQHTCSAMLRAIDLIP